MALQLLFVLLSRGFSAIVVFLEDSTVQYFGLTKVCTLHFQLLSTLKYLPIASKNQLEDSKICRVLKKWSAHVSQTAEGEAASSSSGQDSHGNSPTEADCSLAQDVLDTEKLNTFKKKDKNKLLFERQFSDSKEHSDDEALDAEVAEFSSHEASRNEVSETQRAAESSGKSPDELSEDDGKSEDDPLSLSSSDDDDGICVMSRELLKSWSNLKVGMVASLIALPLLCFSVNIEKT